MGFVFLTRDNCNLVQTTAIINQGSDSMDSWVEYFFLQGICLHGINYEAWWLESLIRTHLLLLIQITLYGYLGTARYMIWLFPLAKLQGIWHLGINYDIWWQEYCLWMHSATLPRPHPTLRYLAYRQRAVTRCYSDLGRESLMFAPHSVCVGGGGGGGVMGLKGVQVIHLYDDR